MLCLSFGLAMYREGTRRPTQAGVGVLKTFPDSSHNALGVISVLEPVVGAWTGVLDGIILVATAQIRIVGLGVGMVEFVVWL